MATKKEDAKEAKPKEAATTETVLMTEELQQELLSLIHI